MDWGSENDGSEQASERDAAAAFQRATSLHQHGQLAGAEDQYRTVDCYFRTAFDGKDIGSTSTLLSFTGVSPEPGGAAASESMASPVTQDAPHQK